MMKYTLALVVLLAGCASDWAGVRGRIECRHRVLAYVEAAQQAGIPAEQVWYWTRGGTCHAIARVQKENGVWIFVEINRFGQPTETFLTRGERSSIYNDYGYNVFGGEL